MTKKRNENIRKASSEIMSILKSIKKVHGGDFLFEWAYDEIKDITHRIKSTKWRGENKKSYEWKQMGYQVKVKDGVGTFEPLPTKQETRKHFYNKKMVCISCGCSKNAAESMKWDCKDVIKPNVSY